MRPIAKWALGLGLGLGLVLALAACSGGSEPSPSPTPSGPPIDSVIAFQTFSGLTIPATAKEVDAKATIDTASQPSYRVSSTLPSSDVDKFCQDGQMDRPLRPYTIPASIRKTFDYQGDSSTGVAAGNASLPSNVRIQRQVLAVEAETPTAAVQVYAYSLPN